MSIMAFLHGFTTRHAVILIGAGLVAGLAALFLSEHAPTSTAPPIAGKPALPKIAPVPTAVAPVFDIVRINPSGDTVIAGRAAPGAEVILRHGGREIGRTRADDRGEWVFLPNEPLPSGARELTVSARIGDGPEIPGDGSVLLVVPERLATGDAPGSTLPNPPMAVLSDKAGAPRVLQGPGTGDSPADAKSPARLSLAAVEYDDQGRLRFAGTAPPGARVRVQIDNRPAGEAVADARGAWSLMPTAEIAPGTHRLRLERISRDGQIAEHADYPFQRETITAKELAEGNMVVRPGNNLWLLARSHYGQGTRYTIIYEANRARLTNPDRIYPGQILTLPPEQPEPSHPAR